MALINCPECGKEISDKAKNCIHCGYPLDSADLEIGLATTGNNKEKLEKTEFAHEESKSDKLFKNHKKAIIACLAGVIAIVLLIVCLTIKPQGLLEANKAKENSTQNEFYNITRKELIAKMGGVLDVSCEEMIWCYDLLQGSEYYIEGKIKKATYHSYSGKYEYEIGVGWNTLDIGSKEKFAEGDYVYVTVKGLSYTREYDTINISKRKTSEEYLTVEEYLDIYEIQKKTRFRVTGYILNQYNDKYCMYEFEEDYTGDRYDDKYISIIFTDEQTNIIGKKVQVIGQVQPGGLYECSLVTE